MLIQGDRRLGLDIWKGGGGDLGAHSVDFA